MANYNSKFEVIRPSLDSLIRAALPVTDAGLLNPLGTSPVPLLPGEFVEDAAGGKYARADNTASTKLAYAVIEDQGDYGVQASGKLSALRGGTYEADTYLFAAGLTTLGAPVEVGVVAVDGNNHSGLIANTTGLVIGYVTKVAADNGGRLRFLQTLV